MTAGKHHAELVVLNFFVEDRRAGGLVLSLFQQVDDFRGKVPELIVAPDNIDRPVTSHTHQPGRRIVGHSLNWPDLEGSAEGVLNHVLGQSEAAQPEDPREIRNHLSRLATEKMVE